MNPHDDAAAAPATPDDAVEAVEYEEYTKRIAEAFESVNRLLDELRWGMFLILGLLGLLLVVLVWHSTT